MFVPSKHTKAQAICERAAQELILRFAFAGLVLCGERLQVRVEKHPRVSTLGTDGRTIWADPDYVMEVYAKEKLRGIVFRLLHEYFHCFFNHPERGKHRNRRWWGIAIDIMTNRLCCESLTTPYDEWKTPEDGVQPDGWEQYTTAEAIYDELMNMPDEERDRRYPPSPPDQGAMFGGTDVLPPPFQTDAEKEEFQNLLAQEMVQAHTIMSMNPSASALPTAVRKRLEKIKQGKVPWARLLSGRLLTDIGDSAATFSPPRKQTYPWLIQPSYKGLKEKRLALLVDNSASVGEHLHTEFKHAVKPACRKADEIHIIGFDQVVREHVVAKRPSDVDKHLKYKVGAHGYTSVVDAFDIIDKIRPSAIACLTDGFIELPQMKPAYRKTIWCVPVNGKKQQWGINFTMDVAW